MYENVNVLFPQRRGKLSHARRKREIFNRRACFEMFSVIADLRTSHDLLKEGRAPCSTESGQWSLHSHKCCITGPRWLCGFRRVSLKNKTTTYLSSPWRTSCLTVMPDSSGAPNYNAMHYLSLCWIQNSWRTPCSDWPINTINSDIFK